MSTAIDPPAGDTVAIGAKSALAANVTVVAFVGFGFLLADLSKNITNMP